MPTARTPPTWIVHAALAVVLGVGGGMAAKWAWLNVANPPGPAHEIAWSALVPLGAAPRRTAGPGRRAAQSAVHQAPVAGDRAFMSEPLPALPADAPLVDDLDGRRVRISGYAVPLETSARHVTEFLLVPYVGACIHVPPPPANQIVLVSVPQGVALGETFAPVTVTGRIAVRAETTSLAAVGYRIEAAHVALEHP